MPNPPRPTEAELEILTVLWSRGPSTVREVHEVIAARKPAHYTTTLKLMQIMADKGLLSRNLEQRAHIYQPSRPQEWTERQLAGDLLQRGFRRVGAPFHAGRARRPQDQPQGVGGAAAVAG